MCGISVSYLTGVTFHRVNILSYRLGKMCKRRCRIIHVAKYFTGEAQVRFMYCKFQTFPASRDILYCINKQISVFMHPFNQTSYNLRSNKTPLGKPRNKILAHLLQTHCD
jgi:hypothetical protein